MVTEKKWKILSDIGLDGHTKDGSILDINLIFYLAIQQRICCMQFK
jgi:hypothetical protein